MLTVGDFISKVAQMDQLTQRVERLLLRYEELTRTNQLLQRQVSDLELERDGLLARLSTARQRVDSLLERLPDATQPQGAKP
jgi:cell division protein ZapB